MYFSRLGSFEKKFWLELGSNPSLPLGSWQRWPLSHPAGFFQKFLNCLNFTWRWPERNRVQVLRIRCRLCPWLALLHVDDSARCRLPAAPPVHSDSSPAALNSAPPPFVAANDKWNIHLITHITRYNSNVTNYSSACTIHNTNQLTVIHRIISYHAFIQSNVILFVFMHYLSPLTSHNTENTKVEG